MRSATVGIAFYDCSTCAPLPYLEKILLMPATSLHMPVHTVPELPKIGEHHGTVLVTVFASTRHCVIGCSRFGLQFIQQGVAGFLVSSCSACASDKVTHSPSVFGRSVQRYDK
jgi:hypothetical protein